jgi:peptide/nickel transport system ATP-binding protein
MSVLQLDSLNLQIGGADILRDVSLSVERGEILGLVGESGSGKTMTLLSSIGLLPDGATTNGSIKLDGEERCNAPDRQWRAHRGKTIGTIFQEPMTALNPVHTIGQQVAEAALIHEDMSRETAMLLAADTLERVGLNTQATPLTRYPHQLSGGQRQRVAIAMAIINQPKLILADEPTTALDVTTQKRVLDRLSALAKDDDAALILVSHDLPMVAAYADRLAIMKDGQLVDTGYTLNALSTEYAKSLVSAARYAPTRHALEQQDRVLSVRDVTVSYDNSKSLFSRSEPLRAVKSVSFDLAKGETVAVVGESGSGKSTLARAILGLQSVDSGEVRLGDDVFANAKTSLNKISCDLRRRVQIVFQDPYGSFNPRHRVERIVAEPFSLLPKALNQTESRERVEDLLASVELSTDIADRYPHQLSGGQRQRVAIARALANDPEIIVLDEAVSALDVSVRARVLDLLVRLSEERGLSYLFVSHDLALTRGFAHRTLVMRGGEIVEQGPTEEVFSNPQDPYTRDLLAASRF